MNWFQKLLHGTKPAPPPVDATADTPQPGVPLPGLEAVRLGHYSDNNKSTAQSAAWFAAEEAFRAGTWREMLVQLFRYLRDDREDAVHLNVTDDDTVTFTLDQGTRRITGTFDGTHLTAEALLAQAAQPGTAVMRRLLEETYDLQYCRAALTPGGAFCLRFDTAIAGASPTKLYQGLRELATKADRQDDALLADFDALSPTVTTLTGTPIPEAELEAKWQWFRTWIEEALQRAERLNADAFAGAIAYLLLTSIYRIDFLLAPEGKLMLELERISDLYWSKKEESPLVERNAAIKEALRGLLGWSREDVVGCLYGLKHTFSIALPAKMDKARDNVASSNRDARWYTENKHTDIALALVEYGVLYNQFLYSMPQVLTDLTSVWAAVLQPAFFAALGLREPLYDTGSGTFYRERIQHAVDAAIAPWRERYPRLRWEGSRIRYTGIQDFAASFADQLIHLNLDAA